MLTCDTHYSYFWIYKRQGGREKETGLPRDEDMSTRYSGRSPTSFSVSAEHKGFSPKSLRKTGCAGGSLLDCYLITWVVLTVNPALRAKTGKKEERLKYTVHMKCWTGNQRALDVFKLPPWVGSWLSDFTAAHQDRLSHSRAHFSSLSIRNYPGELGDWGQEGGEHARTTSHSPASELVTRSRRVKRSSSEFSARILLRNCARTGLLEA